jgi:prolipoprotein diacylglyceryl transferase
MSLLAGVPAVLDGVQSALPADIPSPSVGVWHLGPLPVRGYALCILAGIVVAVWLTQKRLEARGHRKGIAIDISAWAVPFGIVGGRLYHLITTPQPYFGENGQPWKAFAIYEGGLGIWGAVALGAVGAWIGCRKNGVAFRDFVDAAAPGLAIAQAMGRFGNWFNNEIYGAPTDLPWRLRIYEWDTSLGRAVVDAQGNPVVKGYFHPTFLYEALWCLLLAAFLIWLGRHRQLKAGQVFAAYVMGYPVGRIVIENMRTDSANLILGQRVNTWVSILVFLLGVYLWRRFGRMDQPAAPDDATDVGVSEHPDGSASAWNDEPSDEPSDEAGADGSEDPAVRTGADRPNDSVPGDSKVDRPAQS